ncbi:MAG TPA: urea ABC transporter ATP-binding subunit UrtE [Abditibacterium sp.]|jgi:urea transport system ATP-binding protein
MLQIQNLESGYGGSMVLRGVSLKIEPGQVVCLLGRNGVGKTTLLKSLMGLLKAQNGSVSFENNDLTKASPDKRARAGIAYVPQGREVFPSLTVSENLDLGLEARHDNLKQIPAEIFEMFPVLREFLPRKAGALSGGQQQQLAIGRALASSPRLLLLDEPMEGIQPNVVSQIEDAIHLLKKRGDIAVLLVEQSLDFATTVADYTYILDHGKVVLEGKPEELTPEIVKTHLTL